MKDNKKCIYLACMPIIMYIIHLISQILFHKITTYVWDNYIYVKLASVFITIVLLIVIGGLLGSICFFESEDLKNKTVHNICIFYMVAPICASIIFYFIDIPLPLLWKKSLYISPLVSGFYFMLWLKGITDKSKGNIEKNKEI